MDKLITIKLNSGEELKLVVYEGLFRNEKQQLQTISKFIKVLSNTNTNNQLVYVNDYIINDVDMWVSIREIEWVTLSDYVIPLVVETKPKRKTKKSKEEAKEE